MHIFVQTHKGHRIVVEIEHTDTVRKLQAILANEDMTAFIKEHYGENWRFVLQEDLDVSKDKPTSISLCFNSIELDPNKRLADYNIRRESLIYQRTKQAGGTNIPTNQVIGLSIEPDQNSLHTPMELMHPGVVGIFWKDNEKLDIYFTYHTKLVKISSSIDQLELDPSLIKHLPNANQVLSCNEFSVNQENKKVIDHLINLCDQYAEYNFKALRLINFCQEIIKKYDSGTAQLSYEDYQFLRNLINNFNIVDKVIKIVDQKPGVLQSNEVAILLLGKLPSNEFYSDWYSVSINVYQNNDGKIEEKTHTISLKKFLQLRDEKGKDNRKVIQQILEACRFTPAHDFQKKLLKQINEKDKQDLDLSDFTQLPLGIIFHLKKAGIIGLNPTQEWEASNSQFEVILNQYEDEEKKNQVTLDYFGNLKDAFEVQDAFKNLCKELLEKCRIYLIINEEHDKLLALIRKSIREEFKNSDTVIELYVKLLQFMKYPSQLTTFLQKRQFEYLVPVQFMKLCHDLCAPSYCNILDQDTDIDILPTLKKCIDEKFSKRKNIADLVEKLLLFRKEHPNSAVNSLFKKQDFPNLLTHGRFFLDIDTGNKLFLTLRQKELLTQKDNEYIENVCFQRRPFAQICEELSKMVYYFDVVKESKLSKLLKTCVNEQFTSSKNVQAFSNKLLAFVLKYPESIIASFLKEKDFLTHLKKENILPMDKIDKIEALNNLFNNLEEARLTKYITSYISYILPNKAKNNKNLTEVSKQQKKLIKEITKLLEKISLSDFIAYTKSFPYDWLTEDLITFRVIPEDSKCNRTLPHSLLSTKLDSFIKELETEEKKGVNSLERLRSRLTIVANITHKNNVPHLNSFQSITDNFANFCFSREKKGSYFGIGKKYYVHSNDINYHKSIEQVIETWREKYRQSHHRDPVKCLLQEHPKAVDIFKKFLDPKFCKKYFKLISIHKNETTINQIDEMDIDTVKQNNAINDIDHYQINIPAPDTTEIVPTHVLNIFLDTLEGRIQVKIKPSRKVQELVDIVTNHSMENLLLQHCGSSDRFVITEDYRKIIKNKPTKIHLFLGNKTLDPNKLISDYHMINESVIRCDYLQAGKGDAEIPKTQIMGLIAEPDQYGDNAPELLQPGTVGIHWKQHDGTQENKIDLYYYYQNEFIKISSSVEQLGVDKNDLPNVGQELSSNENQELVEYILTFCRNFIENNLKALQLNAWCTKLLSEYAFGNTGLSKEEYDFLKNLKLSENGLVDIQLRIVNEKPNFLYPDELAIKFDANLSELKNNQYIKINVYQNQNDKILEKSCYISRKKYLYLQDDNQNNKRKIIQEIQTSCRMTLAHQIQRKILTYINQATQQTDQSSILSAPLGLISLLIKLDIIMFNPATRWAKTNKMYEVALKQEIHSLELQLKNNIDHFTPQEEFKNICKALSADNWVSYLIERKEHEGLLYLIRKCIDEEFKNSETVINLHRELLLKITHETENFYQLQIFLEEQKFNDLLPNQFIQMCEYLYYMEVYRKLLDKDNEIKVVEVLEKCIEECFISTKNVEELIKSLLQYRKAYPYTAPSLYLKNQSFPEILGLGNVFTKTGFLSLLKNEDLITKKEWRDCIEHRLLLDQDASYPPVMLNSIDNLNKNDVILIHDEDETEMQDVEQPEIDEMISNLNSPEQKKQHIAISNTNIVELPILEKKKDNQSLFHFFKNTIQYFGPNQAHHDTDDSISIILCEFIRIETLGMKKGKWKKIHEPRNPVIEIGFSKTTKHHAIATDEYQIDLIENSNQLIIWKKENKIADTEVTDRHEQDIILKHVFRQIPKEWIEPYKNNHYRQYNYQ